MKASYARGFLKKDRPSAKVVPCSRASLRRGAATRPSCRSTVRCPLSRSHHRQHRNGGSPPPRKFLFQILWRQGPLLAAASLATNIFGSCVAQIHCSALCSFHLPISFLHGVSPWPKNSNFRISWIMGAQPRVPPRPIALAAGCCWPFRLNETSWRMLPTPPPDQPWRKAWLIPHIFPFLTS